MHRRSEASLGAGWARMVSAKFNWLPISKTAACGAAAFRPRCPTRSGVSLDSRPSAATPKTGRFRPPPRPPPPWWREGPGRGELGTRFRFVMNIDATSTPAASTPQADAETGREEDAERHDADHPQVFGFHRSMSPFRKRDIIPSRQTSLTTIIFSFSARSSCTALVVDSSHLKHSAHIMTMPRIHQAICQDHSGGNPAKEKA